MTQEQSDFIGQLVQLYGKRMAQLTYRRTGDRQLAMDLVQDTFLAACCKAEHLFHHENPPGWLYLTLHHLTLRELDRRGHEVNYDDVQFFAGYVEDELPMEYFLPNTLSAKDRELLLMRLRDGLTFEEIAELRGITVVACRQQMSRAVRRCREALTEEAETC